MTMRNLVSCGTLAVVGALMLTSGHGALAAAPDAVRAPVAEGAADPLCISGVYPHLAVFNSVVKDDGQTYGSGGECGIGAVVPWAGKLWMITYSPHCPTGSTDKLYAVDEQLNLEIRPESIGGTPAG